MWYESTVKTAPAVEPVTLAEAKSQCGILADDTEFDAQLERLIKAARSHVEDYCNARWAEQTVLCFCDSFADLARLPEGPLKSVSSIKYVDAGGGDQTLPSSVYQENRDGLEPSISLKFGQSWPVIQRGSRIEIEAVFGGVVPESVQCSMLLFIADSQNQRENAKREDWTVLDALLCNHRRGA